MFTLNGKRINVYAPFTTTEGVTYADLTNPEVRAALGVQELPEPQAPADYSEATHYRTEQDDAPYVVYTRKSDEQINQAFNADITAQIAAIEATQGRALREATLGRPEFLLKIEEQIRALRAQLRA